MGRLIGNSVVMSAGRRVPMISVVIRPLGRMLVCMREFCNLGGFRLAANGADSVFCADFCFGRFAIDNPAAVGMRGFSGGVVSASRIVPVISVVIRPFACVFVRMSEHRDFGNLPFFTSGADSVLCADFRFGSFTVDNPVTVSMPEGFSFGNAAFCASFCRGAGRIFPFMLAFSAGKQREKKQRTEQDGKKVGDFFHRIFLPFTGRSCQKSYTFPDSTRTALKLRQKFNKHAKNACQEKYTFPDRY